MAGETTRDKGLDARLSRLEAVVEQLAEQQAALFRKLDDLRAKPFPWVVVALILTVLGGGFGFVISGIHSDQTRLESVDTEARLERRQINIERARLEGRLEERSKHIDGEIAHLHSEVIDSASVMRREAELREEYARVRISEAEKRMQVQIDDLKRRREP